MTQLRSVTCHMGSQGSHGVACYPTQVNTPCLNPSHTGRYSIYLARRDGRLSWPSWLGSTPAGSRTSDLSITSPTLNHCTAETMYSVSCPLTSIVCESAVPRVGNHKLQSTVTGLVSCDQCRCPDRLNLQDFAVRQFWNCVLFWVTWSCCVIQCMNRMHHLWNSANFDERWLCCSTVDIQMELGYSLSFTWYANIM